MNDQSTPPEVPAPQFYLWHLVNIGLLDPAAVDAVPEIWTQQLAETRVAIIDSGCTTRHPNLPPSAIEGALDVAVQPEGVVYTGAHVEMIKRGRASLEHSLTKLLASADDGARNSLLGLARMLAGAAPPELAVEDPAEELSGHGTACAGLVAARWLNGHAETGPVLPYFGVNPYATIVPIATPYSHEIRPLVFALLHAVAMDADVILLPRAVNDLAPTLPASMPRAADLRASRLTEPGDLEDDRALFEVLLCAIAADRPVVLASGNEGWNNPAYPASLVNSSHFGARHLIVAGASNLLRMRSSYSSGDRGTGVTVYAPSDDEERVDTRGAWVDSLSPAGQLAAAAFGRKGTPLADFPPFSVVAIDVPGRNAADGEVLGDAAGLPTQLLYSRFGGTSAASAIVAGMASLVQAKVKTSGKERLTGEAFKSLLLNVPSSSRIPTGAAQSAGSAVPTVQISELLAAT